LPRKAAIFGTSNGIIHDGYPSSLKQSGLFEKIANYSVGASPCAFLPYRLHALGASDADVVFVESLVNDAGAMRAQSFSAEDIAIYYRDFLAACAARSLPVVGIFLPGKVRDAHFISAYETMKQVFRAHGVAYWDGVVAIDQYAADNGVPLEEMYRDPAHLKSEIISAMFSTYLQNLQLAEAQPPVVPPPQEAPPLRFVPIEGCAKSGVRLSCPPGVQEKLISTSLLTARSKVFERSFRVELEGDSDFEVLSLVLNSNNTNCVVEASGEVELMKSLAFKLVDGDDKVIVTPFVVKPNSRNGRLAISFKEDSSGPAERSYQASAPLHPSPRIELVGFIVREGSTH